MPNEWQSLLAVFPDLTSRAMEVDVTYINRCVGVDLGAAKIAELLSRMALTAKAVGGGQAVSVEVPPTRSDVLHACDIMEVGSCRVSAPPPPEMVCLWHLVLFQAGHKGGRQAHNTKHSGAEADEACSSKAIDV